MEKNLQNFAHLAAPQISQIFSDFPAKIGGFQIQRNFYDNFVDSTKHWKESFKANLSLKIKCYLVEVITGVHSFVQVFQNPVCRADAASSLTFI